MSNRLFCPNCYKPTSYESSPPSFCGNCGKPFNQYITSESSSSSTKTENKPKLKVIVEDDDEESSFVPKINKLDVEIQPNLRGNRQSFEEVLKEGVQSQGTLVPPRPKIKPKGKAKSPKQIQQEWLNNFPKNGQKSDIG